MLILQKKKKIVHLATLKWITWSKTNNPSEIHRAVSYITGKRQVKVETFKSPEHIF